MMISDNPVTVKHTVRFTFFRGYVLLVKEIVKRNTLEK